LQTLIFATLITVFSFIIYIDYTVAGKHRSPYLNCAYLKKPNFLIARLMMAKIGVGYFGGKMLSLYLKSLLGLPTIDSV
jgi:hypothetical protein